jgi:hypothetical protein
VHRQPSATELNDRPRKRLGFSKPIEESDHYCAMTERTGKGLGSRNPCSYVAICAVSATRLLPAPKGAMPMEACVSDGNGGFRSVSAEMEYVRLTDQAPPVHARS